MSIEKNKYIRIFTQLLREALFFSIKLVGSLIPTNHNTWVFGHRHGFTDNAKLLFEYVKKFETQITPVWLYSSNDDIKKLPTEALHKYSMKGIYIQLTAKVFFISTGMQDTGNLTPYFNRHIYLLWHGWPIKKIMLDSPETYLNQNVLVKKFISMLIILQMNKYKAIFCHDHSMAKIFSKAFGVAKKKCVVTGWPRLDSEYLKNQKSTSKNNILYVPTWSSNIQSTLNNLKEITSSTMVDYLNKNNKKLVIKLHPLDYKLMGSIKKTRQIYFSKEPIDKLLAEAETVISDYSSLIIDAYLMEKKIALFSSNFKEYKYERGIYKSFLEVYEQNLLNSIEKLIENLTLEDDKLSLDVTASINSKSKVIKHVKKNLS